MPVLSGCFKNKIKNTKKLKDVNPKEIKVGRTTCGVYYQWTDTSKLEQNFKIFFHDL